MICSIKIMFINITDSSADSVLTCRGKQMKEGTNINGHKGFKVN